MVTGTFWPQPTPLRTTLTVEIEPASLDFDPAQLTDEDVVARVRGGETWLFELLMRRHNQRLFRTARAILGDDHEAEDVIQDAWVRAYGALDQFEGRSRFSTWLVRIAVHEASAQLRRRKRRVGLEEYMPTLETPAPGPEQRTGDRQIGHLLETEISALPEHYRLVFM